MSINTEGSTPVTNYQFHNLGDEHLTTRDNDESIRIERATKVKSLTSPTSVNIETKAKDTQTTTASIKNCLAASTPTPTSTSTPIPTPTSTRPRQVVRKASDPGKSARRKASRPGHVLPKKGPPKDGKCRRDTSDGVRAFTFGVGDKYLATGKLRRTPTT